MLTMCSGAVSQSQQAKSKPFGGNPAKPSLMRLGDQMPCSQAVSVVPSCVRRRFELLDDVLQRRLEFATDHHQADANIAVESF
jgi:hypothetical protein